MSVFSAVMVFKREASTGRNTQTCLRIFANDDDALMCFMKSAAAALFVRERGHELQWAIHSLVSVAEELEGREGMDWRVPAHVMAGLIEHEEFECDGTWGAVLLSGITQVSWDASREMAYKLPLKTPALFY